MTERITEKRTRAGLSIPVSNGPVLRHGWMAGMLFGLAALAAPAAAQEVSDTFRNEIATLKLTVDGPNPDGRLRGSLSIDMEPGWKTYWLDPGPSGIPPQIDLSSTSGFSSAEILVPLPHRFGEGLARANGYAGMTAFALDIAPKEGEALAAPIVAKVFIGVCKEICVPVQAELSATPKASVAAVDRAFARLPAAGDADAVLVRIDGGTLEVALSVDQDMASPKDLFVSGPVGWSFGEAPAPAVKGDRLVFAVPIEARPTDGTLPEVDLLFDDGAKGLGIQDVRLSPEGA